MKKTRRQSTTSTMGVMLMNGSSSACDRSEIIGRYPPPPGPCSNQRMRIYQDASVAMEPRFMTGVVAGRGEIRSPIRDMRPDRFRRNQVDHLLGVLVEVADQE